MNTAPLPRIDLVMMAIPFGLAFLASASTLPAGVRLLRGSDYKMAGFVVLALNLPIFGFPITLFLIASAFIGSSWV